MLPRHISKCSYVGEMCHLSLKFRHNSPETIVYNQCANAMLPYAIKYHQGLPAEVPTQLFDQKTPVPVPPLPGDIQVIVAGFPW